MKIALIISILIFGISNVYCQHDCSAFYPFEEGKQSEITHYDKKGKVTSVIDYEILKVYTDAGSTKATMSSRVSDKDGELITSTEYDVTCIQDGVSIDFKSMYSPQLMAQYQNMRTTVTGTNVELPNSLKEGQQLPDAELYLSVDMGGININVDIAMEERKVVGEESVTTPAGSFDCYVVEYTSKIKMGLEKKIQSKQWFAPGIGMVKQEDYNRKGKVMTSSLLTKI